MFCPNCGIESETSRKFCRSCGMSLGVISQALTGQIMTSQSGIAPSESGQPEKYNRGKVFRYGLITFFGGILLAALLGITGGALENLDSNLGSFVATLAGLGGLVLLAGIFVMIYSLFLPKTSPRFQPRQQHALPPPQHNVDMQSDFDRRPASSVTENTTELLDPPASKASN